jgi:hypothetical protein
LHLAAQRGYRKCMKLLFAHHADMWLWVLRPMSPRFPCS